MSGRPSNWPPSGERVIVVDTLERRGGSVHALRPHRDDDSACLIRALALRVRLVLAGEQAEENADIVRRVKDLLALRSPRTAPIEAVLAAAEVALGQTRIRE